MNTEKNSPKKLTLLVLAAGMGSRYGGIKQIDGFGPNGETIMDYSLFDAIRAGFTMVVLSTTVFRKPWLSVSPTPRETLPWSDKTFFNVYPTIA